MIQLPQFATTAPVDVYKLCLFEGFDPNEPTSRDGGKPAVVKSLIASHGYKPVVMIGDGATDMQAKPPADAFVGFGGIVVREKVKAGADWFITDFKVR